MVCSLVSFEIGGRTPRASQVSRMMFDGWFNERHGIFAFSIYSMGYALSHINGRQGMWAISATGTYHRVFSVNVESL